MIILFSDDDIHISKISHFLRSQVSQQCLDFQDLIAVTLVSDYLARPGAQGWWAVSMRESCAALPKL